MIVCIKCHKSADNRTGLTRGEMGGGMLTAAGGGESGGGGERAPWRHSESVRRGGTLSHSSSSRNTEAVAPPELERP